ncbi:MAG: hypothetical protein GVY19_13295 [Bacteroidetes bacterium]|jgi:nitrogenase molybdenum-iron protein NifN|nr:hypothetical protein [Bacteroidota bacterium]
MKIAVCTSAGFRVDRHFGKTSTFYIYEIVDGYKQFIEKRHIDSYCSDERMQRMPEHPFNRSKLEAVYEVLKDCKKLYTEAIGDVPKQHLIKKGIEVYEGTNEITSIPC